MFHTHTRTRTRTHTFSFSFSLSFSFFLSLPPFLSFSFSLSLSLSFSLSFDFQQARFIEEIKMRLCVWSTLRWNLMAPQISRGHTRNANGFNSSVHAALATTPERGTQKFQEAERLVCGTQAAESAPTPTYNYRKHGTRFLKTFLTTHASSSCGSEKKTPDNQIC